MERKEIMENTRSEYRKIIARMKQDIKDMSADQVVCKVDRKTVHHIGSDRRYEAGDAAYRHYKNRLLLKNMFIWYGMLRNKPVAYQEKADKLIMQKLQKDYPMVIGVIEGVLDLSA